MSEAIDIANLILGIVGTITGSVAIIIHYWRLKRENPCLKIEVLRCEHDYAVSTNQVKTISLWARFRIKNLGDRGATINDMDLVFRDNGKEYRLHRRLIGGRHYAEDNKKEWINAHETRDILADFYETFEGNEREQLDCILTLYHTHGAETVKAVSQKKRG